MNQNFRAGYGGPQYSNDETGNEQNPYPTYPSHPSYPNYDQQNDQQPHGSAQSYYGSNNEPYQQYAPSGSHRGNEQQPLPMRTRYDEAGQYAPRGSSWANERQPLPNIPRYDEFQQSYAPPGQHHGWIADQARPPSYDVHQSQWPGYNDPDVQEFRSHFDQPAPGAPAGYGYASQENFSPAEGERGIMGALAGGAAGAFAGHKVNHGIVGALGGAYAGHKLEDHLKDKHKKEKKQRKHGSRRGSHSSNSSRSSSSSSSDSDSDSDGGKRKRVVMAGNFRASSHGVHIEQGHILVADCANVHGRHVRSHLDLNGCLTNEHGRLKWARNGNAMASSRNVRLTNDENVLEAECGDGRGGWVSNRVQLNERITNTDGRLELF